MSDLPNVDYPTITVSASLPGASPETMAATVATPLEKQFSTIAGIDNMTSTQPGQTQIVLQFTLDRNIDAAAQDVQAAITQTLRKLPQNIIPPSYQKTNPAGAPILYLALTSDAVPLWTLDEFGETTIAQRLSMVSGVAQVLVYGAQKYAVRVQLDPAQLASRGLGSRTWRRGGQPEHQSPDRRAVGAQDRAHRAGHRTAGERRGLSRADRGLPDGAPVHLRELGRVRRRPEQQDGELVRATRAIVLAVQRVTAGWSAP